MKRVYILSLTILLLFVGCSTQTKTVKLPTATPESTGASDLPVDPIPTLPANTASPTSNAIPENESATTESPTAGTPKITETRIPPTRTATPRATATPTTTAASLPPTATPRPTLGPIGWKKLPVIPTISDTVNRIYQRGLELGKDPHAFSKVGDCGSTPSWFLGDFDRGEGFYSLGEYEYLESVIEYFQGSFGRTSLAARSGFNTSSLLVTLWTDLTQCESDETPLACEYRLHQPSIAFITLGANDVWHPEEFQPQMRKIIEYSIENGVIPILSTKPDNIEGDHQINQAIAQLAYEYDIPLWNYWLAVQPLPDHGLQEDGSHLTWARNFFDDPIAMEKAWPVRNLNALQMLDAIWRKLMESNASPQ